MRSLIKDERADNGVVIAILLGTLLTGVTYLVLSKALNFPIEFLNDMTAQAQISHDTTHYTEYLLDLWRFVPIAFVLGLAHWILERSKNSSFSTGVFFEYLILMLMGVSMSIFMMAGFGLCADIIINSIDSVEFFVNIGQEFDVTASKVFLNSIFYYVLMFPGIITMLLFIAHPMIKQRENSYVNEFFGDDTEQNVAETINTLKLEQM